MLVVPYFSVGNKPCSIVYNTNLLREPFFFVYNHEVHSCFQKSHQHRKWNPRVPCICTCSSPKMSQKTTCDVKRVHLLLYVIHAVTPFWPMYYIILSFLCSCLKKQACHRHLHGFEFWLQKIFSVLRLTVKTFWSNLHFCHVMEKLMDLWLGWKCVTKLPLRAKDFLSISHNVRFQWFLPHSNKAKSLL